MVGDGQADFQVGKILLKAGDARNQPLLRDERGGGEVQAAVQPLLVLAHGVIGAFQRLQQFGRVAVIRFAFGGNLELARGALQQRRTQMVFQIHNHLADGGVRHLQQFGRPCERFRFHHFRKYFQCSQLIHGDCPY